MEKSIENIYAALGTNDAKRALFLCQKNLKKSPSHLTTKILLAFSFSICGKEEEAEKTINEVFSCPKEKLPVDSSFINSLVMTCKKLHKKKELSSLLEWYVELYPNSEDLLIEQFFAYVRNFEFKKASQKTNASKHFIWAALSLYNQAQKNQADDSSLTLFKRMLEKCITENHLKTFQDYSLCMFLPLKDTHMPTIPEDIFPTLIDKIKYKVQVSSARQEYSSLIDYCLTLPEAPRAMLEDWEVMIAYLDAAIETKLENPFFWEQLESLSEKEKNVSLLARIEYAFKTKDTEGSRLLGEYFSLFGHKDSCFSYLQPYLAAFPLFAHEISSFININRQKISAPHVQLLTALKINEFYYQNGIKEATKLDYLECVKFYLLSKTHDTCPCLDYLILAIMLIIRDESIEQEDPFPLVKGPHNPVFALGYSSLVKCASLLLFALAEDVEGSGFTLKLLSFFLFRELGAVSLALEQFKSLNIKFIQLDILSFLILDWIPLIGFKDELDSMYTSLSNLYRNNEVETPELLIEAYTHGSLSQVPEFVDLHLQLKCSIQRKIAEITIIQSEMLHVISSPSDAERFFSTLSLPAISKTIVDNRPFGELFPEWCFLSSCNSFLLKFIPKETSWIETCFSILLAFKLLFTPHSSLEELLVVSDETKKEELLTTEQVHVLLEELTKEEMNIDPTIFSLLNVVKFVLVKKYHLTLEWISKLLSSLSQQLETELTFSSGKGLVSGTPDSILVKVETYVELVHYLSIFICGLNRNLDQERNGSFSNTTSGCGKQPILASELNSIVKDILVLIPNLVSLISSCTTVGQTSQVELTELCLVDEQKISLLWDSFLTAFSNFQALLFSSMEKDWARIADAANASLRQSAKIISSLL